jgi:engulfment/cell motility protein 1
LFDYRITDATCTTPISIPRKRLILVWTIYPRRVSLILSSMQMTLTNRQIVDLSVVSSVVSNVSATPPSTASSTITLKQSVKATPVKPPTVPSTSTKITIHGYLPRSNNTNGEEKEQVLLQLLPATHTLASEWLDGLLMLLNQQPITADTNKLVNLIGGYGLKIRLLNVRFDEESMGVGRGVVMPSREGVDEAYWYDIGGMEQG